MNISGRRHFLQSAAPAFLLAGLEKAIGIYDPKQFTPR